MTDQMTRWLNVLLSLLSWIWIWLASFAGKLMTNGFVYGEFMNLDKVLYYLWNLSRTFANFLIVGLLLMKIVKDLMSSQWIDGKTLTKYVVQLAWGAILINLSRFLVGATVDISTILTTSTSWLANSYIASETNDLKNTMIQVTSTSRASSKQIIHMENKLCANQAIVELDSQDDWSASTENPKELLDKILPSETSISWPLLYLGIGVLQLQNFQYNSNNPNAIIDNLFVVSTRLAIILSFTIIMALLVMINIFRLVTIRLSVAFWPLLIILWVTKQDEMLGDIGKKFSRENIFKAIFAPVVAVGLLSVSLIAIVMMQSLLQFKPHIQRWDAYISSTSQWSLIGVNGIFDTTIAWDILGNDSGQTIKNTFTNILLIVFTLFILFGVVKVLLSFLSSSWLGHKTYQGIADFGKEALGSMPIIPSEFGWISINSGKKYLNKYWLSSKISKTANEQNRVVENKLRKMAWLQPFLNSTDYKALTKLEEQFNKSYTIGSSQYNSLIQDSNKFIDLAWYKKQKISISGMQWVPSALEAFLKNLSKNNTKLWAFGGDSNKSLSPRDDKTSTEQFIQANFKDNRIFFQKLYSDLGGDPSKLYADGSNFWSKAMQRNGNTPST